MCTEMLTTDNILVDLINRIPHTHATLMHTSTPHALWHVNGTSMHACHAEMFKLCPSRFLSTEKTKELQNWARKRREGRWVSYWHLDVRIIWWKNESRRLYRATRKRKYRTHHDDIYRPFVIQEFRLWRSRKCIEYYIRETGVVLRIHGESGDILEIENSEPWSIIFLRTRFQKSKPMYVIWGHLTLAFTITGTYPVLPWIDTNEWNYLILMPTYQ